jgi:hypothetical protein
VALELTGEEDIGKLRVMVLGVVVHNKDTRGRERGSKRIQDRKLKIKKRAAVVKEWAQLKSQANGPE